MSTKNTPVQSAGPAAWYAEQFASFERGLNGGAASRVHTLRKEALAQFTAEGFPTTRHEEWRFTNLSPLTKLTFTHPAGPAKVTAAEIHPYILPGTTSRLVFVNGRFDAGLSNTVELPAGIRIGSLASALAADETGILPLLGSLAPLKGNAFAALQTAFLTDGAFIDIPDGVTLDVPVELLFIAVPSDTPVAIQPRNFIRVGKGARLAVVETYAGIGSGAYLTNVVSEILIGDGGVLEHDKLQLENSAAFHIGSTWFQQGQGSTMTSNSIALGGALVRNTVTAAFAAPGSECTLNGLSVAGGDQLIDNHTAIDHAHPHCDSHELYKSVLDGSSRGVFNGKIFVRQDAQKTDARQTNKTLLLSDNATIDTKPQLEIFADDVKCTHGATVGQLDEAQVFYLRARGIGEVEARDMLTFAFASDVVDRVHVDALRERLNDLLHQRLHAGRVSTARI
jgi:Fe-S cluster assembly protein SufD